MSKDWSIRNDLLSKIRNSEIESFLSLYPDIDCGELDILDLGCGKDKYLKNLIKCRTYVGVDLVTNVDIVKDVCLLSPDIFKYKFIVSFGLFCLLSHSKKKIVFSMIKEGCIHINRNDTDSGRDLENYDNKDGINTYYISYDILLDVCKGRNVAIIQNPWSFIVRVYL